MYIIIGLRTIVKFSYDHIFHLIVGVNTMIIVADFTNPEVLPMIVKEINVSGIDVGALVNNVGLLGPHYMSFLELDNETVKNMINVNVLAATVLCHAILPDMKKKGRGAIINISSAVEQCVAPYLAVYSATKHYMSAFTQAIAAEYSNCGVTIQCVEPGEVSTEMTKLFIRKVLVIT